MVIYVSFSLNIYIYIAIEYVLSIKNRICHHKLIESFYVYNFFFILSQTFLEDFKTVPLENISSFPREEHGAQGINFAFHSQFFLVFRIM